MTDNEPTPALWPTAHQAILAGQSPAIPGVVGEIAHIEYAIRYGDNLVRDTSWHCIADVIATYHGTDYLTSDRRVTGQLVRRELPDGAWEVAS